MSSIRRGEYVHEELLEERLRILLDRLGWTYAALWTLNPRTRLLEWKRGCFNQALVTGTSKEGSSATASSNSSTVWDAHLFFTTYKSCSFAPGRTGAIGRANFEGKHSWLTGDAVCQNAVSLEQSQFLSCSKIQTMMCIPWVDSVLEIGTAKLVGENLRLMDQIQEVLSHDLLEPDPFEHAPPAADVTMFQAEHRHSSRAELPTNMALQQRSSIPERELPPRASNHRSASFQSGFILSDQVWSQSRDFSARPSVSSDELHQQFYAKSSPNSRFPAHDRTSSSTLRQQQQLASPYSRPHAHQIRRTTSCGDENEVKKALSLYEAQEMQDQWHRQARQLPLLNSDVSILPRSSPSPEPTAHYTGTDSTNLLFWQRDGSTTDPALQIDPQAGNIDPANSNRPTVKRSSNASLMNQVSKVAGPLLRRQSLPSAWEVLKAVDNTFQMQAAAKVDDQEPELSNVTSYDLKLVHQTCEDQLRPSHHVQMTAGPNLRGRRRSGGVEHPGHDEAAVNHMLTERRRRVKQKENFNVLRRLVPIISKADKASTLQDAITYLKHLQTQIQEMEARKEDIDQRCEVLEHKCKKLEQRNQDLLEIVSKEDQRTSSGTTMVHLNEVVQSSKLQSTKSI